MSNTLATNPYGKRDYLISDTYDAGIVLLGSEIKSLRNAQAGISGAYIHIKDNEAWLVNAYIAPYGDSGHYGTYDARRPRKLLLNRRELDGMIHKVERQRLAIVPLYIYLSRGRAKLNFGIGTGRKKADRREFLRQKEINKHKESQFRYRS